MSIKIVTDSTCDLPEKVIKELNITVIPLFINVGDKGYLDGIDITRKEFYTSLPKYTSHPTTGTPGAHIFTEIFNSLAVQGATGVLSIHISRSLSAVVDIARSAAHDFIPDFVSVRDSGQLSMGTGFQVETAARMALEGRSIPEIVSALDDLAKRIFVTARLDTLEFLRRSGRMNSFMAGLGSLLQLKPLMTMKNGQPGSERIRTIARADARLVELLKGHLPVERFTLLHTNAPKEAEAFRTLIVDLLPSSEVYSMDITPVIGAHIGPGAVGYALVSQKPV